MVLSIASAQWENVHAPSGYMGEMATIGNYLICQSIAYRPADYLLIRSSNNGSTWDTLATRLDHITNIAIIDSQLFAATFKGVFMTQDNGTNWNNMSGDIIWALKITNWKEAIFVGSDSNRIYKSRDRGMSWQLTNPSLGTFWINDVRDLAVDSTNVYAILSDVKTNLGELIRSTNGGADWQFITNKLPGTPARLFYLLQTTGKLFVTTDTRSFCSSDGGNGWDTLYVSGNARVAPYNIYENKYIVAVGDSNTVYFSHDTGRTWLNITSNLPVNFGNYLTGAAMNNEYLFVGRYASGVWRRPLNSILSAGGDRRRPERLEVKYLSPNPCSNRTSLKFFLFRQGMVSLTIHDLLGRKIGTVADDFFESGERTIPIDASNLRAGIYFYRLSAFGIAKSGKMVVLR